MTVLFEDTHDLYIMPQCNEIYIYVHHIVKFVHNYLINRENIMFPTEIVRNNYKIRFVLLSG